MPSYRDLLDQSMLFTATRGAGTTPVSLVGAFDAPTPRPDAELDDIDTDHKVTIIKNNPIWHFEWSKNEPATFRRVTIKSRGMGMNYRMAASAIHKVQFHDAKIVRDDDTEVKLPFEPEFVLDVFWAPNGKIPESSDGLWQLEAKTDTSLLVAFGYQLVCGEIVAIPREDIDALGDAFIPERDRPPLPFGLDVHRDTEALVCIGPTRYLVLVELVLCKERPDFVPGGLIGMARYHPHALMWSNEDLKSFECSVDIVRRAKAMTHGDPEMDDENIALVVSDTNEDQMQYAALPVWPARIFGPIPYTDIIYDYYVTDAHKEFHDRLPARGKTGYVINGVKDEHPRQNPGEICMADPRHASSRFITAAVRRGSLGISDKLRDIVKMPRQGQFDNIHIAPRMQTTFESSTGKMTLSDIAMVFVCMHDCLHAHVRWAAFDEGDTEKIIRGWKNGRPFSEPGAPTVPENQAVFVSFPLRHGYTYRAVAEAVPAGALQVVYHHGGAYAVDVWPSLGSRKDVYLMRETIENYALSLEEPFMREMPEGWAAFYWRVQYGGQYEEAPQLRLKVESLARCMR